MEHLTRQNISDWSTQEKLILLQGWAMDGLTMEDISKKIGINKTTLYDWMKKDVNITNALKIGREQADNVIVNALYNKAKSGDTTAMIFWLKNRMGDKWREKQEISTSFPQCDFEIKVKQNATDND